MSSDLKDHYAEEVEIPSAPIKNCDLNLTCELKEKGNQAFKEQNTDLALEYYEKAIEVCPQEEINLRTVLFSNMSIVYLRHVIHIFYFN